MQPHDLTTATSTALLQALMDGSDDRAWSQFVLRYRPLLVRYGARLGLRSADIEDYAQATLAAFADAYRAGNYERTRGRLRDWLFGIARNQLRVAGRGKRHPFAELTDQPAIGEEAAERTFDEEWQREVLAQCLEEIRGEVGAQTFEAFDLFGIRGVPARVVGDHLGMSENAVFLAKRRTLLRLREVLPVMERVW